MPRFIPRLLFCTFLKRKLIINQEVRILELKPAVIMHDKPAHQLSPNVYRGNNNLVIHHEFNEFPDIIQYDDINPTISSPNSMYDLQFYMTKETLLDVDLYRQFISNAVGRFRRSRDYKAIKNRLMSMGMDHCQVLDRKSVV